MKEIMIVDFTKEHVEKAKEIALMNYEEERSAIPILPKEVVIPDLTLFADNHLGVTAFAGSKMLGFLCAYQPWEDAFGTTNVRGTYSPMYAHGVLTNDAIRECTGKQSLDRDRIYSLLYQEAAKKWVKAGIRSHSITLYTHDKEAVNSLFYNGFGLRCIDAIRSLEDLIMPTTQSSDTSTMIQFGEVPREEWRLLLPLNNRLIKHLGESPSFMKYNLFDEKEFYRRSPEDTRYFAAKAEDRYIAYIKTSKNGENFATEVSNMVNISGAYCEPSFRGTGVYHNLLCHLINTLNKEGYQLLGVDCESFNPTARGFWLKYFAEYTHSMVRRIDDKAVDTSQTL